MSATEETSREQIHDQEDRPQYRCRRGAVQPGHRATPCEGWLNLLASLPIDGAHLAPFLPAVTLIELTPGPDMAYLGLLSVREGFTAGFLTAAGITLGLAACLLASVAGLAEFAARETWAYRTLRWVGGGYLLWLALDAWRGETRRRSEAPSRPVMAPRLNLRGFLINILNPKAAIFYLSLLPGRIRPERGQVVLQGLALGAVHLAIAVTVHAGFAAALVAVAAWVAWTTRSA